MPFLFSHVCDLLQEVSDLPPTRRSQPKIVNQLVFAWFGKHRQAVDELCIPTSESLDSKVPTLPKPKPKSKPAVALLSTLLPERRPDRVYGLQARGLQRILIRVLGIGHSRVAELNRWQRPAEYGEAVDLADCVEAILQRTPNPATKRPVTVEEIDAVLDIVAARCRFSAPSIRQEVDASSMSSPTQAALGSLYQRLDARGAKWLTRLILKDFRPAVLDGGAVVGAFHPSLPMALQVHASLDAAVMSLQADSGPSSDGDTSKNTVKECRPLLGVKVGRQQWLKGRSIEHCISMAGPYRMSCERKMDGEYVQVHVDLRSGSHLQIFSKSGKDSTRDRASVHGAIRAALRIGRANCKLTTGCILEGEMLAYDEYTRTILDFDAIRKHVNRSGTRVFNTEAQTQDREHLMMVWYDVLLVDGESLLGASHAERFRRLEELVDCRQGYSELVQREVIDFSSRRAASQLRQLFAKCIAARLEGLVIKPDDDPYFSFAGPTKPADTTKRPFRSHCIKLKKEYNGTFGEVGDFAVIGARYDAAKAMEYPPDSLPGRVRWTHFFIGCLNKAKSTPTRPYFIVTNVVTLTAAQMATFLTHCRPRVVPFDAQKVAAVREKRSMEDFPFDMGRVEPGIDGCKGGPTELFADPPVVDIRCFSFHRQGYGRFWGPRFPCVVKFHFDRTYLDVIAFEALQAMGNEDSTRRARVNRAIRDDRHCLGRDYDKENYKEQDTIHLTFGDDSDDDEEAHWVDQLKKGDRRGIAVDAETSQSSGPTAERSQSSAGASQFSMASLPNAHAYAYSQLHTQQTQVTHNDFDDTHTLHEIHEIHEIEETDRETGRETDRETGREADGETYGETYGETDGETTEGEASIAGDSPVKQRCVVEIKRQAAAAVIDLTEEEDVLGGIDEVKAVEEARDAKDEKDEVEGAGKSSYAHHSDHHGLYLDLGSDSDFDYDSDASQQGIALLFAQEEARLSQPSQSYHSQSCSSPPSLAPAAATSPPSTPARSSPAPPSFSVGSQQSQPARPARPTPTQKRVWTWDVASSAPISPPALKRARSGV